MHELIPQTFNVVLLAIVLVYFLRKPTSLAVSQRQDVIKKDVEESRLIKQEAEKKFKEFEKKIQSLEAEASEIVSQAKTDADALKVKIISTAKANAEKIIKDAEGSAAVALADSRTEIRNYVVSEAINLAEKLIREKISTGDQKRILNDYVGKVD